MKAEMARSSTRISRDGSVVCVCVCVCACVCVVRACVCVCVCARVCNYVYIGAHGSISIEGEIDLDKDRAFDKLWDNYMDGVMGNIFYICLNVFGGKIDLDKDLAFDKLWDNYMDCFYRYEAERIFF